MALEVSPEECLRLQPRDLICRLEEAAVVAQCQEECRDEGGRNEKALEKDVVQIVVKVERLEQFKVAKMSDCDFVQQG